MGWGQAIAAAFGAAIQWLKFQGKEQELKNQPEIKANKDAARKLKEKEHVENAVAEGDRTGDLTKEREIMSE